MCLHFQKCILKAKRKDMKRLNILSMNDMRWSTESVDGDNL